MENNKKILINFSLYFLTLLLIIIVGVSNVFADSYDGSNFSAQLYDNLGPTLNAVTTNFESSDNSYYGFIGLTANSSGGAWGISSPTPLLANHTYTMSAEVYTTGCGSVILSTYNRIGVGTSLGNARSSYMNNTYVTENYSYAAAYNILQFAFTPTINASHIVFAYSSTGGGNSCTSALKSIAFQDLGAGGVSESTINNSLNNQTNILNNSITASTNDITTNSNNNRDAIINNQNANNEALIENDNANTDRIIDENKKNFNDCRDSTNLFDASKITNTNIQVQENGKKIIMPIVSSGNGITGTGTNLKTLAPNLQVGDTVYLLATNNSNGNKLIYLIGSNSSWSFGTSRTITQSDLDSNVSLYANRYSSGETQQVIINDLRIVKSNSSTWEQYGEICVNRLDQQTNAINGLNDNINDDNTDGATSEASDFFSEFNTNTFGLTSIITAPLNLIQSLTSKTCTPLHLPLPYLNNKYLDLPCMSTIYSQHFGTFFTLYQTITYGIIAYWVCVRIFNHVKDFKNPEHDEIEVVDL